MNVSPPVGPDSCNDRPLGCLWVDLPVRAGGDDQTTGLTGSDLIGAWLYWASSQSCPPARPAVTPPASEEKAITSMPTPVPDVTVTVGVDTHKDVHVAVALDALGRRLGDLEVPTTTTGYHKLHQWAAGLGQVDAFGVEGTGSYGAGLTRHLRRHGIRVIEVNRPDRATRHRKGKSDPIDAEAAARAVLAGTATGTPKAGDDQVEVIRTLKLTRDSAVKAQTQAVNQLKGVLVTAPAELRESLNGLGRPRCWKAAQGCVPASPPPLWPPPSTPCVSWPGAPSPFKPRPSSYASNWPPSPPRPHQRSSSSQAWDPTPQQRSCSPPATTPNGSTAKPRSQPCAAPTRSRRPPARSRATASTGLFDFERGGAPVMRLICAVG